MNRLLRVAQSLSGEARGLTRKMEGVRVAILVYDAQDEALSVVHDDQAFDWDALAGRMKATGEEIRVQQRAAVAK